MHSLVRFANIAAGGNVTTADLYVPTLDAIGLTESQYSLAALRYDLAKLRAKELLEKVPHSAAIDWSARATRSAWFSSSYFEKIYAPLTAGLLAPFRGDCTLPKRSAANSIDCTNASLTISTRSCEQSA